MPVCKILFIENQISQFETIVGFFETFNKINLGEIITYIRKENHTYVDFVDNVQKYLDFNSEPEIKHKAFANILSFIKRGAINDEFNSVIFEIIPDDTYDNFIDNIRVYLNNNYEDRIRQIALINILSFIDAWNANDKFDFIIIDHKLVGCHNSKSGIHLAELLKNRDAYNYKIIFLSRNTTNDKQVTKEFAEVSLATSDYIWITKGYAGVAILQEDYFRTQVIDKIKLLFQAQYKLSLKEVILSIHEKIKKVAKAYSRLNKDDINMLLGKYDPNKPKLIQSFENKIESLRKIIKNFEIIDTYNKAENFIKELINL